MLIFNCYYEYVFVRFCRYDLGKFLTETNAYSEGKKREKNKIYIDTKSSPMGEKQTDGQADKKTNRDG